jgi:hypothetical protein
MELMVEAKGLFIVGIVSIEFHIGWFLGLS